MINDWYNRLKRKTSGTIGILLAVMIGTAALSGCRTSSGSISKTSFYLNTVITITLYDTDNEDLLDQGINLCRQYDHLLSKTYEKSDIYAINHSDGQPVHVSEETIRLINKGLTFAALTDGKFNIAIGAVSDLWDFTSGTAQIPSRESLSDALALTDYSDIVISGDSVTVPAGMQLDLGAIAKGYIGDRLKEFYLEQGVSSALLNLGGNIVCIGTPPDKDAFHIGIKKPFSTNETITDITICDQSVVTSGIYERYFKKNDTIYHHILDPFTGYPMETDLYSVTIVNDNSILADILSTTCLMLGYEQSREFLKSFPDAEAVFVTNEYAVHSLSGN